MALLRSIATGFGVDATYWHVLTLQAYRLQGGVDVTLAGYVSSEARWAGHRPIAVEQVTLAGPTALPSATGIHYADVYAALKDAAAAAQPDEPLARFAGAADG
ncbi:hypothetical protein [Azospirillum halopraeferens]|uniref:hypothetical protein n=1 Tax=Azospirillum halopraeferens TaxID=34010 RepID=UPI000424A379|nr:hypothetical protein [Azospirillum halopraeferens]